MLKRVFDIVASGCGLIIFSPLLIGIAVWVKMDSSGPVFYRGRRAARGGGEFGIFKFRSMVVNADKIGGPSTSGNDSRVTKSGRFIRRYKLDELSQLLNVFVGQMSLVGPRPEVVDKMLDLPPHLKPILEVRPGITDWASIWNSDEGGLLEGTPDPDAAYEAVIRPIKLQLQLEYVKNRTFLSDIKILAYTVLRLFRKSWIPDELKSQPSFNEMRQRVLNYVNQATSRRDAA